MPTITLRSFIKTLGLGAGALSLPGVLGVCGRTPVRSNVVLINVNDLGWADVGCFGSRHYETPDIDRLPHYRGADIGPYSIVRAGEWKLIERYEGPTFELFNLAADLSETTDLAAERPEIVAALDQRLGAWLAETGARMPWANPNDRPA